MDFTFLIPSTVIVLGAFFLIKLKAFFIFHPVRTFKRFVEAIKAPNAFANLTLALAGTLGVGNIFGVAAGIAVGGPGSVFWLVVASVFSSVIKYAESVTSADHLAYDGRVNVGGMMYVLHTSFGKRGKTLGSLYAILCLLLSLFMGCAFQCSAVISSSKGIIEADTFALSLALTATVCLLLAFGKKKIEKTTSLLIPIATIIYVFLALSVIISNGDRLKDAITDIFTGAFEPLSVGCGFGAFILNSAMREGFSKGVLSNEAGVGTSAMANVRTRHISSCDSGLFGMCEVFFDSVVLCTLTGLAILTGVENAKDFKTGTELVNATFKASFLGNVSEILLLLCILCFAISTVICWYYYGGVCMEYLCRKRKKAAFTFVFVLFVFIGPYITEGITLRVIDVLLTAMSLLTAACLIKNSDRVVALSEINGII